MIDAPGFLWRDSGKFGGFAAVWYNDRLATSDCNVSRIIWTTDYGQTIEPEQRALAERFAEDLEAFLGFYQTKVSSRDAWYKSRHTRSGNILLSDFSKGYKSTTKRPTPCPLKVKEGKHGHLVGRLPRPGRLSRTVPTKIWHSAIY